jgi:hypothetical protein
MCHLLLFNKFYFFDGSYYKMSLIITSSQDPKQVPQNYTSTPWNYRNDIRSGIKIPPNSEIAVESVKINRNPQLDYEQGQVTLFWMGERLATNASLSESMSWVIPVINNIDKNLSPSDFSEQFLLLLKSAYSQHPEIDSNNITMEPVIGSSGFAGFRFNINQVGAAPTDLVPITGTEKLIFNTGDWDGTTFSATSDDVYVQLQPEDGLGGPISLYNGEVSYNNINASQYTVGLCRPLFNKGADYIEANPHLLNVQRGSLIGTDQDQVYDYAVQVGLDNYVRVYHLVPDTSNEGFVEMREIRYYEKNNTATTANNGVNSSFASGNPILASSIDDITFKIQNEKVIISASGNVICSPNVITSASFKDQVPKPVNQNCWKMYPTFSIWDDSDELDISTYRSRTNSTMYLNKIYNNWLFKCNIHADMNTIFTEAYNPTDARYVVGRPWDGADFWPSSLDERPLMKRYLDYAGVVATENGSDYVRPYKGLNGSALADYEPLLITGSSERYTQDVIQAWTPNSMNTLGFSPLAVVPLSNSVNASTGSASFSSFSKPNTSSENSTFIRVPTLNHKTFNFGTGNPSKILFQVPRFDNSGAETGALFFQNPDKTFIDLNNPTDFTITDLDIQFVRKDERFATDLTGSSEVVFYIRNKSRM